MCAPYVSIIYFFIKISTKTLKPQVHFLPSQLPTTIHRSIHSKTTKNLRIISASSAIVSFFYDQALRKKTQTPCHDRQTQRKYFHIIFVFFSAKFLRPFASGKIQAEIIHRQEMKPVFSVEWIFLFMLFFLLVCCVGTCWNIFHKKCVNTRMLNEKTSQTTFIGVGSRDLWAAFACVWEK